MAKAEKKSETKAEKLPPFDLDAAQTETLILNEQHRLRKKKGKADWSVDEVKKIEAEIKKAKSLDEAVKAIAKFA